jgi:hypothetical protein
MRAAELAAEERARDVESDCALMLANALRHARGMDNFGHHEWVELYAQHRRPGSLVPYDVAEAVALVRIIITEARQA